MPRSWLVLIMLLGATLTTSSCKDDAASESGPALDDVPALFAKAVCQEVESCAGETFLSASLGGSSCTARVTAQLQDKSFSELSSAVDTGSVVYRRGHVEVCLSGVKKLDCDVIAQRLDSIDGCEDVFVGEIEVGDDCDVGEACSGDAFCKREDRCPGTCTERKKVGDACADNDECKNGLVCSADGECEKPADEAEACGGGVAAECALGMVCIGADAATAKAGTCKPNEDAFVAAEGDTCDLTAGVYCSPELACIATLDGLTPKFTCASKVASKAACNFGVPSHCPDGEFCDAGDINKGQFEGSCLGLPGMGEACLDPARAPASPLCTTGLFCGADDKCRELGRIGDACSASSDCAGERCEAGECAEPEACEL